MSRPRFWLYRNIVGVFTLLAFRSQKVVPIEPPSEGEVGCVPYAEAHPGMPVEGLFVPTTFPRGDRVEARLRRIRAQTKLLALVQRLAPARTGPVPTDGRRFVRALSPRSFRRAWPAAPTVPSHLETSGDLVAELATRGPYGSYLRRRPTGEYVVDLSWMEPYDVEPGLARPGGVAVFGVHDGRLVTAEIVRDGMSPDLAPPAYLAALNEDFTTFRHNVSVHLTMLTSFALASASSLDPAHPVRRLLHHCFNTVLIGNVEVAAGQVSGAQGFSATIFSHDAGELRRMVAEHLRTFDFWDFEPPTQFERRGTVETPFRYPYRDNVMQHWGPTLAYVERIVALYYEGDDDVAKDSQLASWAKELDRLLPNGVAAPARGLTVDWLVRVCATLIHVSTVEHDLLNNVAWNYSTLGWLIPTVAPTSGEPMDRRRAFDLITTLIGTWKPYNMLFTSDVPKLALDERAATVMADWIKELDRLQNEMDAVDPTDVSLVYPVNLNVSISN